MRVTNSMMSNSVMYNINKNLYKLNTTYSQMSSGKMIQNPSDDPVGASTVLKYTAYNNRIEQYQTNSEAATSWLKITEDALSGISDSLDEVRDRMVEAFNGTLDDDDKSAILETVKQMTEELVELCNTEYTGRSIFGGYETDSDPVAVVSTSAGDKLTYHGKYLCTTTADSSVSDSDLLDFYNNNTGNLLDSDDKNQKKEYNTGFSGTVVVNTEGWSILGEGESGLYETLQQFTRYLSGDTTYKTVDTSSGTPTVVEKDIDTDAILSALDDNIETVLGLVAQVGAKQSALELSTQRLTDGQETYKTLLSETQDADLAKVTVEYSQAQSVYEASLSSASKLILPSLLDFLS